MAEALLGLGGNTGDVRATLDRAIELICLEKETRLLARSAYYRTPPWGFPDQPAFINAAIAVETGLTPEGLLAHTQSIERLLGRTRGSERRFGPRPIDIDLLAYDDLRLRTPDLELPHPRLLARAFVLVPLTEIAPERIITGVRVRDALAQVDTSGIERVP
jgi:2-amino-4-hydroxy-6-hydroxymethyldihydropteridine diphosphokinase